MKLIIQMIPEFHHLQGSAIALSLICIKMAPIHLCRKGKHSIWHKLPILKGEKCVFPGSNIKTNFHLNQIITVNDQHSTGQDDAS